MLFSVTTEQNDLRFLWQIRTQWTSRPKLGMDKKISFLFFFHPATCKNVAGTAAY